MRRILARLLPEWARTDHPLLQYELSNFRHDGARLRFIWQFTLVLLLVIGSATVYALVTDRATNASNISEAIWPRLYFPTLILQTITLVVAYSLGANAVHAERSRKTWDSLRATEIGAGLALRARWVGIIYRLRVPILAIVCVRLLLIIAMLTDLTAFGGRMTHMLSGNATPPLPDWRLGLLLIALNMALSMILPLLMLGTAVALGILLSVALRERVFAFILQILLMIAYLALTSLAALGVTNLLQGNSNPADATQFALFFVYSGFGDWGLLLMQLGSLGEIWHSVPYSTTITLGLAIQLLIQSSATDGMMSLASRLSESRG